MSETINLSGVPETMLQTVYARAMGVVDNENDENNENTRRKATVVSIKIEYVWEGKPLNNVDVQKWTSIDNVS